MIAAFSNCCDHMETTYSNRSDLSIAIKVAMTTQFLTDEVGLEQS